MRTQIAGTQLNENAFMWSSATTIRASGLAADTAQQMGLPRGFEMDGGFTAWKNAGYPVAEREKKKG